MGELLRRATRLLRPRHVFALLALFGACALLTLRATDDDLASPAGLGLPVASTAAAPAASPGTVAASASPPVDGHDATHDPAPGWRQAASGFVKAYTTRRVQPGWSQALEPYCSPQLAEGLRWTDPRDLPAGTFRRLEVVGMAMTSGRVDAELTSGTRLALELAHDGQRWNVVALDRVAAADAPDRLVGSA